MLKSLLFLAILVSAFIRTSSTPAGSPTQAPSAAAPRVLSATFSSDGSYIVVAFSAATNQAGFLNTFVCSKVLDFPGVGASTCSWTTASTIAVYASSSSLNVGSSLDVIVGNGVKAACPSSVSSSVCSAWSEVSASSVTIAAPATLAAPVVSLMIPSTLSGCPPLYVDLSASTGSGGRAWQSPVFTVTSAQGSGAAVAAFLNRNYTFSGAFYAPSALFPVNGLYTIRVTLTNFLGAMATSTSSVTVNKNGLIYPTVVIPGLKSRTVLSNAVLSLTPSAYTSDCAGVQTTTGLVYTWTVTKDGLVQTSLVSTSADSSKFRLPAYSLTPLSAYDILVTATNTASGRSGTATVSVTVQQGALVAQVAGGSAQSILGEGSLTLDASSSYDQDKALLTGTAAGLSFAWTCAQTLPSAGACPLTVTGASLPAYVVTASSDATGTTSAVTVTVADSETGRTSSTTVLVTVQNVAAPQVAITSTAHSVTSVNVDNRLSLAASVTTQSVCTAQWSVDASTVSLASSALSALTTSIPAGATRALNLVIAASALPQRASLVFTLACGESSAAITVTTNGPPLPGVFAIAPTSGVELSTSFAFSASFWSDTDLPITYQFGFLPPSGGSTLTVRTRSEASTASNTLPAGSSTSAYAVTCSVLVYDVLNAVSSATTAATVNPQTDVAQLQASLAAQLTASAGNVDATKSAISIGSAVINAVSCTAAPACAPLNRASCAKVQNTCGACLSGYLGDSGDHNSQCVSASSTDGKPVGSSCATDSECGGFLKCNTALSAPVCFLPAKSCPDDCSGHGTCVALNANSMKQISSCSAGDSSCIVSCVCAATYSGANCGLTEADLAAKQDLRFQYLQSLSGVSSTDDVDSANVASLSSSLSALTQNSYELSGASVDLINQVANSVLNSASGLEDFTFDQAVGVLGAIDAAAAATVRMNTTNTVAFANQMMQTIALFNQLVSSQLVAGQDAVDYIQDSFRTSSIRQLRGFNSSIKISSPTTLLEQSNGGRTSSVSIDAAASGSRLLSADVEGEEEEFAVNMVETAASSYGELGSSFNSNPVQVTVSRTAATATRVTFVLAHNEAGDFTSREEARSAAFTFNSTCTGLTGEDSYFYTCPFSGEVLFNNCTGLTGVLTSYCPVRAPTCAIVNGTTGAITTNSSDCEVLSFDLYSTTCSCLVQPSTEATVRSRRLSLKDLQQTGLLDAVSVTVYLGSEFKNTFNSAKDLNSAADLQRVLIVIIMFCALWAGGILLIFSCTWRRNAMKKVNQKTETHREKKVQVAEVSRSPAAVQAYLADYVIQTFPSVFSNKPFFSRVYGEIKRHHRYLTLFTAPEGESGDKQRILTGVQLLTIQTMLMFLLAMLYDVESPSDDGTCPGFTDHATCTARKSVFDTTVSYCNWNDYNGGTCEYRNPVFSLKVMLYISVIVAILTAIISYPSDYIFELLSAPVADEAKAAAQESAITKLGRRASNVARRASNAALTVATAAKAKVSRNSYVEGTVTVKLPGATEAAHALATASMTVIAENSRRTIMNRQMTRMRSYQASGGKYGVLSVDGASSSDSDSSDSENSDNDSDNNIGTFGEETRAGENAASSKKVPVDSASKPANEMSALLAKLSEEVHCQRRLLKPSEVEEFDTQWGLDPTGEFTQGERSVVPCLSGRPGAEETLLRELKFVKKESNETAEKLSIATDAHTGLEILHLFIKDLLGRDTPAAIIFETKSEEDFQHTKVVTRNTKRLAAVALACLNGFFVYYAILTGFRKGVHWQQIYLAACIVQFVVEIFLFETMEVVWLNCAVPILVSDEVRAVGDSIIEVVQHLCNETPAESRLFLNAPDYLFVSTNVAKQYPHLMESILVQAYNNHVPGELARKWQVGSIARMHRRRRRKNVTIVGMFFRALQYLGTMPFLVHRMAIRFIQPFVLSGLALLWQLIVSNVIYIAVAVFVLLVILAYGLYRRYLENQHFQKNQNITPILAQYGENAKLEDEAGSDEDFHKALPMVSIVSQHSKRSASSRSGESKNGSEGDTFDPVPRKAGSVDGPARRPSVSDSELSSTDLSVAARPVRRSARNARAAAKGVRDDASSESEFSNAVERRHRAHAESSSVSDESQISSDELIPTPRLD